LLFSDPQTVPSFAGFCFIFFSLSHIWNKNKEISLQSDELDFILADSGLGDSSQILVFKSEPVESLKISTAKVLCAGGV
jgi:hypothetical protein